MIKFRFIEEPSDAKLPEPGPKLDRTFGNNLDTVEKARTWLSHPSNWIRTTMFIIKWDGYLPYIEESRAKAMVRNPKDDTFPLYVVLYQKGLKAHGAPADIVQGEE